MVLGSNPGGIIPAFIVENAVHSCNAAAKNPLSAISLVSFERHKQYQCQILEEPES